jgi:hypothetical protein
MKTIICLLLFLLGCSEKSPVSTQTEKIIYVTDSVMTYEGVIDSGVNCIDCCPNRLLLIGVDSGLAPSGKLHIFDSTTTYIKEIDYYERTGNTVLITPINCHVWNGLRFKVPLVKE